MTEAEWLACDDPVKMLRCLLVEGQSAAKKAKAVGPISARKVRLFACALFRQIVTRGAEMSPNNHTTIGLVERRPERPPPPDPEGPNMGWAAALRGNLAQGALNILGIPGLAGRGRGYVPRAVQAALLRDIVANPFRPPAVTPAALAWNDAMVVRLARAADRHRARQSRELNPTRLAILADALEDAGCSDGDVLDHLRSPGPHVRGCWAVDLALGKA